jgi:diguanylate cyclase (GGDEF)-like protein
VTSWEERATKVLDTLHLDSIKNRILALAVLAALIPALATVVLSYRQNRSALTDTIDSELRSIVSQSAREIDLWVDQRSYEVRVFTGSFEVSENLARIPQGGALGAEAQTRLADYLVAVYGRTDDYAGLLATDAQTNPMASTGGVEVSLDELPPDWRARVQRGDAVMSEPYVDPSTSRTVVTLAVPIEAGPLTFVGSLAATLRFDAVDDILADFTPEGGSVALVTADGDVIASSQSAVGGEAPGVAVEPDVLEALTDAEDATVGYTGGDGVRMVGTATPVPGLDWAVIAQVPEGEAYAEVTRLRNSAFLLVSLILVVVGGIAYMLGALIVRPLARLTEGAGAVAAGDLSVDLPAAGSGEVGYLTQVFNDMVGRLRSSREELDERNQELERLSVTDLLTGLHNRRYLLEAFDKEIRRADRHERPFCVLMIDVDRFKQFNDTYGHLAGDEVLRRMGDVLKDATRDLDVVARYGGEEFICLLPECDVSNAVLAGERIRRRLAEETFEGGPVTISVGAAEFPTHGQTAAEVIAEADAALYEAKAAGRDQVKGAPPKPVEAVKEAASQRTEKLRQKRGTASTSATAAKATKKVTPKTAAKKSKKKSAE